MSQLLHACMLQTNVVSTNGVSAMLRFLQFIGDQKSQVLPKLNSPGHASANASILLSCAGAL